MTRTPLSRSKGQRSRSTDRFGWLFKSLHNVYRRDQSLRNRPERAAACRLWIFMAQGALGAAGVRRVGYGLEVGRSVRTAGGGGGGILCRHNLFRLSVPFMPRMEGQRTFRFGGNFLPPWFAHLLAERSKVNGWISESTRNCFAWLHSARHWQALRCPVDSWSDTVSAVYYIVTDIPPQIFAFPSMFSAELITSTVRHWSVSVLPSHHSVPDDSILLFCCMCICVCVYIVLG